MKKYEIWLVPNGRRTDFSRGITGRGYPDECKCWGMDMSLEDVRKRYRELASENFSENDCDGGTRTAIWCAAEKAAIDCNLGEEIAREVGEAAADKAEELYLADLMKGDDPLEWGSIEWHNDLKFVTIRESENED